MSERVWFLFNDEDLRKILIEWVEMQTHPKALKNAQFITQQMAALLKNAKHLQKTLNDLPPETQEENEPMIDVDLNNIDEFRRIIGVDWADLR